jgi:hypothetical protein
MSETLLRDRVELEKQRDAEARLNRTAAAEMAIAVLRTRFDAFMDEYRDRAVSDEDLKALKRELEAEMTKQLGHICDHFDSRTDQQSKELTAQSAQDKRDVLNEMKGLLSAFQSQATEAQLMQSNALLEAQRRTRIEIIRYGIGFALSVLTALTVIWLTK